MFRQFDGRDPIKVGRREIVGQQLAAFRIRLRNPFAGESGQWIAEMILLLQRGGGLLKRVRGRSLSRHGDRNHLRLAAVEPVGISIDGRKYRAQGDQSLEIKLCIGGHIRCHGAAGRKMLFDERIEFPRQQMEWNAELAECIQEG